MSLFPVFEKGPSFRSFVRRPFNLHTSLVFFLPFSPLLPPLHPRPSLPLSSQIPSSPSRLHPSSFLSMDGCRVPDHVDLGERVIRFSSQPRRKDSVHPFLPRPCVSGVPSTPRPVDLCVISHYPDTRDPVTPRVTTLTTPDPHPTPRLGAAPVLHCHKVSSVSSPSRRAPPLDVSPTVPRRKPRPLTLFLRDGVGETGRERVSGVQE